MWWSWRVPLPWGVNHWGNSEGHWKARNGGFWGLIGDGGARKGLGFGPLLTKCYANWHTQAGIKTQVLRAHARMWMCTLIICTFCVHLRAQLRAYACARDRAYVLLICPFLCRCLLSRQGWRRPWGHQAATQTKPDRAWRARPSFSLPGW